MKRLKQEKGSITLFVLVSMLFFVLFLAGMYMLNSSKEQTGISETARIKGIYEKDVNQIDDIYATLVNDLIYYVKDKNGNRIPIPKGFSPITTADQGTKETGFVIKNDTDGNEYVWVPVDDTTPYRYGRYAFLTSQPADGTDDTTNSIRIKFTSSSSYNFTEAMPSIDATRKELDSVNTYKGFYIGRFEVGIIGYDTTVSTSPDGTETWTGYSNGTAVVQEGKQVWNYITRDKAREVAESMYRDNDAVISRLCSSYAWDTALKFIETNYPSYPTNSVGGYYSQSEASTTGYDTTHPCNIYDMGGNVWECTTEISSSSTKFSCTLRGGDFEYNASITPAAYRVYSSTMSAGANVGFRSTLYL